MRFPTQRFQNGSEYAEYHKRRDEAQRTGKSLTKLRLAYVERMQAAGKEPLPFTKWLPRRDEL